MERIKIFGLEILIPSRLSVAIGEGIQNITVAYYWTPFSLSLRLENGFKILFPRNIEPLSDIIYILYHYPIRNPLERGFKILWPQYTEPPPTISHFIVIRDAVSICLYFEPPFQIEWKKRRGGGGAAIFCDHNILNPISNEKWI